MTQEKACSAPGCVPSNHDLCLCGHDRMDHSPVGCFGFGAEGCYPRCETFTGATQEQVDAFFEGYMRHEATFGRMKTQEESDAFRGKFLTGLPI